MSTKKTVTPDGEIITVKDTPEEIARQIRKTETLFLKTPNNHDTDAEARRTGLLCTDKSKTQQQFKEEADINNILARFLKTGDPSILNPNGTPQYMDIEKEFDLQERMVTSAQVEEEWNKLPKQARAILGTPSKFLEWYDRCLETGDLQGLADIGLVDQDKLDAALKPPQAAAAPKSEAPGGSPAPEPQKPGAASNGAPAT